MASPVPKVALILLISYDILIVWSLSLKPSISDSESSVRQHSSFIFYFFFIFCVLFSLFYSGYPIVLDISFADGNNKLLNIS